MYLRNSKSLYPYTVLLDGCSIGSSTKKYLDTKKKNDVAGESFVDEELSCFLSKNILIRLNSLIHNYVLNDLSSPPALQYETQFTIHYFECYIIILRTVTNGC